ncbi:MAG: type II secretion system protein, partial [Candidatus Staskawiczbacteria bacterium]
KQQKGFTLLEILLVIALIAILAGIVIVAINPAKQLADGRNTQRRSDVNAVIDAIYQYSIKNNGDIPGVDAVTATSQVIGTSATGCDTAASITCAGATTVAACLNLTSSLAPDYIVSIPKDPSTGSDAKTFYYINKNANGRVTVGSCSAENSAIISVTK